MSRNYDNWERLVNAVLRRELLWRICHEQSRSPSLRSSISSDFSSSFRSTASLSFKFLNPGDGLFKSALPLPFHTVACLKTSLKLMTKENLVLFEDSLLAFKVEELLISPCLVLGDNIDTFSSTYVVSIKEDANVVVMRGRSRWKKDDARREVLNQRLKIIQSLKHENVVSLRGFFISDGDGSFGIYDYFRQGSLHTMLHGGNKVDLDWEARIKIAIGAAKGLLHIHRQGENFIHGSVKATNVFLNSQQYGCLDVKPDYTIAFANWVCHTHAPEVYERKNVVSQAGDVYSFGVLLIELVSGRSPLHYTGKHKTFADWGLYNSRDELTTIVFDREMLKYSLAKQAMWDLLGVAALCVKKNPHDRPNMNDVAAMLVNIDPN